MYTLTISETHTHTLTCLYTLGIINSIRIFTMEIIFYGIFENVFVIVWYGYYWAPSDGQLVQYGQ